MPARLDTDTDRWRVLPARSALDRQALRPGRAAALRTVSARLDADADRRLLLPARTALDRQALRPRGASSPARLPGGNDRYATELSSGSLSVGNGRHAAELPASPAPLPERDDGDAAELSAGTDASHPSHACRMSVVSAGLRAGALFRSFVERVALRASNGVANAEVGFRGVHGPRADHDRCGHEFNARLCGTISDRRTPSNVHSGRDSTDA